MDIESFVRSNIKQGEDINTIKNILSQRIQEYKPITDDHASKLAQAVIDEVEYTLEIENYDDEELKEFINYQPSYVKMGQMGVGSRGAGDFFVHRRIADIIASTQTQSLVNPEAQDDGGVVKTTTTNDDEVYITTAIDGIHSRLSEYPFLGGFHVTRATLRDVCVMGAEPVAIISDIHLADDGDVSKIFDFTAGVSAVSELINVPVVAGSTLRVGGDMVLGDRLVSAVGAIGVSKYPPTARKGATKDDIILLTEGSGGGTITTTALYHGLFDVVKETLDINFIKASNALMEKDLIKDVHAMTDVTNGGLRGDAHEISTTTGLGLDFDYESIRKMVTPKVLEMLESLNIDPLGVSTDSLMIITPPETVQLIKETIKKAGVKITEIGTVTDTGKPIINYQNNEQKILEPQFREAAYTPIKKLVGDTTPEEYKQMQEEVLKSAENSINKKDKLIKYIQKKKKGASVDRK